jgi:hypothetical protein
VDAAGIGPDTNGYERFTVIEGEIEPGDLNKLRIVIFDDPGALEIYLAFSGIESGRRLARELQTTNWSYLPAGL